MARPTQQLRPTSHHPTNHSHRTVSTEEINAPATPRDNHNTRTAAVARRGQSDRSNTSGPHRHGRETYGSSDHAKNQVHRSSSFSPRHGTEQCCSNTSSRNSRQVRPTTFTLLRRPERREILNTHREHRPDVNYAILRTPSHSRYAQHPPHARQQRRSWTDDNEYDPDNNADFVTCLAKCCTTIGHCLVWTATCLAAALGTLLLCGLPKIHPDFSQASSTSS